MTEQAEHPKGTPENPLTREDVLRLRDEFLVRLRSDPHAPQVLDFYGKWFEKGLVLLMGDGVFSGEVEIDGKTRKWHTNFGYCHFQGVTFNSAQLEGARFQGAHLDEAFFVGANLRSAELGGAFLQKAQFWGANLERASFAITVTKGPFWRGADLRGASFVGANLEGANFAWAQLEGADFSNARLRVVRFSDYREVTFSDNRARLSYAEGMSLANYENVDWGGDYQLDDELAGSPRYRRYQPAQAVYRILRQWHTDHGVYDVAGEFFYREMECKRKGTSFRENPGQWLWLNLLWGPLGYGEKPARVVGYGFLVWLLFAAAYFAAGILSGLVTPDPLFALYLSAVSFTAVGYGPWIDKSFLVGWVQGLAAFESFVGVFMIAVFVTTFVRKMTR